MATPQKEIPAIEHPVEEQKPEAVVEETPVKNDNEELPAKEPAKETAGPSEPNVETTDAGVGATPAAALQPLSDGLIADSSEDHSPVDNAGFIDTLEADTTPPHTESDLDSTLGDDMARSSTTSLNSSVTTFRELRGRRYHAFESADYWLPNDEEEISRLELQHFIWKISMNGLGSIAPLRKDIHRALDVGTGTGKWAIEFADEHPSCQVIGTDLSPIQPTAVPTNCSFIVDNLEEPWVWPEPFDFIHSRMLCLGMKDWPRYFQQCFDNLKPGGWVEAQDTDLPIQSANPDCPPLQPLWAWSKNVSQCLSKVGIDTQPTKKFRKYMEDVGFINVGEQKLLWPVGSWPKGEREKFIGRLMVDNVKTVTKPTASAMFTRFMGWTSEQVDEFEATVQEDLQNHKIGKYYGSILIVYGQKPPAPEPAETSASS